MSDLASILTGEAPAKSSAPALDPSDALIRTVYGEAPPNASPEERRAIASVIVNRARKKAGDKWQSAIPDVVLEPGQFEPWHDPKARARIEALTADSPDYKAIATDVGDIAAGKANPYPDLTSFYAPDAQAALKRPKPGFDDGTGTRIGAHLFFGGGKGQGDLAAVLTGGAPDQGAAPADDADKAYAQTFGDPAKYEKGATLASSGRIPFTKLTADQKATYAEFDKGHYLKGPEEDVPDGTIRSPFWETPTTPGKDAPPGSYYVDMKGKLVHAPGGDDKSSPLGGLMRGGADVVLSGMNMLPGVKDSTVANRMKADQMAYDADYKGDPMSGLGRFVGQVGMSAPILAGGEGMVAPALSRFGLGRFLLGKTGSAALPETATAAQRVAQLATRGASLAASGAGEGAGASALTSSASDVPLSEQMATGAVMGGLLKPAGAVVGQGVSRFIGSHPLVGGAERAEQERIAGAAKDLPVPVPMSLGDITRAPAQQMAENGMLRGSEGDLAAGVVRAFDNDQQVALRGNVKAISDLVAGHDVAPGEGAKAVSERLVNMRETANKAVGKAYDEARARGEDAMLSTARDLREGVLDGLRREYNLDRVKSVAGELEHFGEGGAPTVRDLYDMRSRLSKLSQSSDTVEGGAARKAISGVDAYIQTALKNDLFLGDPKAVSAWKDAIRKRADFGRLFEGDDLIEGLTTTANRGGGRSLKVDPEEAANYILGRSDLGWVGKRNLGRDLKRLQGVLGSDSEEWNGLRGEVFMRLAKAGEGPPEAGTPQFSGQKFFKAWDKAKRDDPQVVGVMFTPDERALIDKFAEVAQVVTTPVKGGDNTSNSAITGKQMMQRFGQFMASMGGASGGAAMGGPTGAALGVGFASLMKDLKAVLAVSKARKFTYDARLPSSGPSLKNALIPGTLAPTAGAVAGVGVESQPND